MVGRKDLRKVVWMVEKKAMTVDLKGIQLVEKMASMKVGGKVIDSENRKVATTA